MDVIQKSNLFSIFVNLFCNIWFRESCELILFMAYYIILLFLKYVLKRKNMLRLNVEIESKKNRKEIIRDLECVF